MPSDQRVAWQKKFDSTFPDGVMMCLGNPDTAPLYPAKGVTVIRMKEDTVPRVSIQAFFVPKEFVFDVVTYELVQEEPVPVVRITTSEDDEVRLSGGLSPTMVARMKEGSFS